VARFEKKGENDDRTIIVLRRINSPSMPKQLEQIPNMATLKVKLTDGTSVTFDDQPIGTGARRSYFLRLARIMWFASFSKR